MILADEYPTALGDGAHTAQVVATISEEVDGVVAGVVAQIILNLFLFAWGGTTEWQPATMHLR